ncbi:MAG: hypothetical protein AAGA75_08900 [Cyanobacteria bacterium P01_E01_bin.6]
MPTLYPTKITFRLPSGAAKALYQEAVAKKVSSHQAAKDMVLEHMNTLEILELLSKLLESVEEVSYAQTQIEQRLKAMEWGMIETLSIVVAKQENIPKKDARAWIRNQFRPGVD